jgi:hypothetical protein
MSALDRKRDQIHVQAGVTPGEQPSAALIISLDEFQEAGWTLCKRDKYPAPFKYNAKKYILLRMEFIFP